MTYPPAAWCRALLCPNSICVTRASAPTRTHGKSARSTFRPQRSDGTTTLAEVEELCDTLAVLVAGKVVHTGTVAALVRDARTGEKRSLEAALKSLYEKGQAA